MKVFLQLNLISATFGFLFFISGFGIVHRYVWADLFGLPGAFVYYLIILLWVVFQVSFFKVAKKRMIGSFWHLLSIVLWFPYVIIWSLVISSVIPDGVLQDQDDFGAGFLLLFASIFVYPVYIGLTVLFTILQVRGGWRR
ncbi:hypothetical protein FQ087_17675 [Sporosarcina sp. ANT_H38]|uniref:hypothetical protein n=1 Tax=Sporosarcina sp. ANT_H38 TaxID=2597358 RepID=UPI0011F0F817|nr:hypothetical protein [Sporosarcina sp. ANT_H38]KAA0948813.1 hypothetical protein FQ087_17675 [Sporosarcina sp. ANT_H38]